MTSLAQTQAYTANSDAIYHKKLPKNGEIVKDVQIIANGFSDVVAIGALAEFIYIADSELGFYAIEHLPDGDFSDPRPMELAKEDTFGKPKPKAMVVFKLGALTFLMNAATALTASVALMALF